MSVLLGVACLFEWPTVSQGDKSGMAGRYMQGCFSVVYVRGTCLERFKHPFLRCPMARLVLVGATVCLYHTFLGATGCFGTCTSQRCHHRLSVLVLLADKGNYKGIAWWWAVYGGMQPTFVTDGRFFPLLEVPNCGGDDRMHKHLDTCFFPWRNHDLRQSVPRRPPLGRNIPRLKPIGACSGFYAF
jgi:hypothetical protein